MYVTSLTYDVVELLEQIRIINYEFNIVNDAKIASGINVTIHV